MQPMSVTQLEEQAKITRRKILEMLFKSGSGHPGGSLSATDIVTTLYFNEMKINPKNPKWEKRDRFVLSKGHAAPLLYATLAYRGFFEVDELVNLRKLGSFLQGHPDMKKVPGVDMSTGSLGQGLSVANGMALAGRLDKEDYRVFVVLGDGEVQEGEVWEAAMASAHYGLDNLVAFLDHNNLQIDGLVEKVMGVEPLADKWKAFGWDVHIIDGHNISEILEVLSKPKVDSKPRMIIANTIKGKGVSFMEGNAGWHGKAPNQEELEKGLGELI